jgi:hypothetical protein
MPDASCDAGYDTGPRCWRVRCKFGDVDIEHMTYDEAERRAQRIRAVVTPAVRVDVDKCPYEIFDGYSSSS